MVSVLHKELEYRVEKLKYQMSEVIQLRIKNKSEPPVRNKHSRISPHKVLQSWFNNTVYHLLVENNKGKGTWGLKKKDSF